MIDERGIIWNQWESAFALGFLSRRPAPDYLQEVISKTSLHLSEPTLIAANALISAIESDNFAFETFSKTIDNSGWTKRVLLKPREPEHHHVERASTIFGAWRDKLEDESVKNIYDVGVAVASLYFGEFATNRQLLSQGSARHIVDAIDRCLPHVQEALRSIRSMVDVARDKSIRQSLERLSSDLRHADFDVFRHVVERLRQAFDDLVNQLPLKPESEQTLRNLHFLMWYEEASELYHSYAKIRDKWNREAATSDDKIAEGKNGREVVKKALISARKYLASNCPGVRTRTAIEILQGK